MTAQSHTRRTVLTTGAAVAGAAVGSAALAACGSEEPGPAGSNGQGGAASQTPGSSAPSGQPIAALDDVPVGSAKAVTTPDGQKAIVSRQTDTEVAAFSAVCTHQGCAVKPEGTDLTCPCHGSIFDAFTGDVKNGPATEPLPAISVKVENNQIVTT